MSTDNVYKMDQNESLDQDQMNEIFWRDKFNKYNINQDDSINLVELRNLLLSKEIKDDIPDHQIKAIFHNADQNLDGELDWEEFLTMVNRADNQFVFSQFKTGIKRFVNFVVPRKISDDPEDSYDNEYSCWPPVVCMLIISLLEIIFFVVDTNLSESNGPISNALIYDPHKRKEIWRYLTYMFVHVGNFHITFNVLIQIFLGAPLEMVHRGVRVVTVYLSGVAAASLGTSIIDPTVRLAGASGGVYSLISAHLADIIMNWSDMSYPLVRTFILIILMGTEVIISINDRYVLKIEDSIGYTAHFFGSLAGLLVGIVVLRNIKVTKAELIVRKIAFSSFVVLLCTAILFNLAFPSHFPEQYN